MFHLITLSTGSPHTPIGIFNTHHISCQSSGPCFQELTSYPQMHWRRPLTHDRCALIENGYLRNLVQKTYRQQDRPYDRDNNPTTINKSHYPLHPRTVRSHLPSTEISGHTDLFYPSIHPKDPIPTMKKSCDKSYVGQTGRNLSLWIKEHNKAVETFNTDTSALAEHVLSKDHHINWEETTVIGI